MKKVTVFILLITLVSVINAQREGFSRDGKVDVQPLFNDLILPGSGGVFRGVKFDMSKSAVKNIEDRATTSVYADEEENELVITTDMGDDILNFADITYTFDEKGLYHIKVETYSTAADIANDVYDKVKRYFQDKYGSGTIADDGFLEYESTYGGYNFVVALDYKDIEGSEGMYIYIYVNSN